MFHSTGSNSYSVPNAHLLEQALNTLKQTISSHIEHESRIEKLYQGWQQKWLAQCEQLRNRIETLEAQLAPWMVERADGPRLAVVPVSEDAA